MLNSAVVKVSFQEPAGRVSEMIRAVRSFGTKEVHLVHVRTSSVSLPDRKRALLESMRVEAEELGLVAETHVLEGDVSSRIFQAVWQLGADYVCIAWVHKAVLRQALLGSIDSDIVRLSDTPVFIFKRRFLSSAQSLDSVLYATDFKGTDSKVMPYLKNRDFQARALYMLHVSERAPDPATDRVRREKVVANLQRLAVECRHAYEIVEPHEAVGSVRKTIIKKAKKLKVDLIVVGKADSPDMLARIAGSTADFLPHRAPCSVFIIPGYRPVPDKAQSREGDAS